MKKFKSIYMLMMLATVGLFSSCNNDDDGGTDDGIPDNTSWLFATTHSGEVARYNLTNNESLVLDTPSNDAEGIYYDDDMDALTVVSRDPARIQYYTGISMWDSTASSIDPAGMGSADLSSPRDIAVDDDVYVISDNADVDGDDDTADGTFYIYTRNGNNFTLRNTVTVDFNVWGIVFEDDHLYAIVDNTNMIARFDNFVASNTADGEIQASKMIAVEGIVRTHGLDYDGNTMILTDIGDAGSDSDGALHTITNFESKFNAVQDGDTLALNQQMRIAGANTHLGNPVNVVYDADSDMIYVAELANGGGRVLGFANATTASGDVAPEVDNMLAGVSALYLEDED